MEFYHKLSEKSYFFPKFCSYMKEMLQFTAKNKISTEIRENKLITLSDFSAQYCWLRVVTNRQVSTRKKANNQIKSARSLVKFQTYKQQSNLKKT